MVAGDLVNTAAPLQSVARPGPCSWARRPSARPAGRSPSSRPASRRSRARLRRCPPGRRSAVVAERGGRNRRRPWRRPSSGARTSCACSRSCSTRPGAKAGPGSCRSSVRPASARAAWPGSSYKYVDGLLERSGGTTGARPAYGEGISFWALGEMVRVRCGLLEGDDEPTDRARRSPRPSPARPRRGAALDRARPAGPARAGGARRSEQLFARLAALLRAAAGARGDGLRGPPRRQRASSTSSTT